MSTKDLSAGHKFLLKYTSSNFFESVLFYFFLILGPVLPPTIAYLTGDWIWTIVPTLWWLAFMVLMGELSVHWIMRMVCWWDELIGARTHDKAGLGLFVGLLLGLILNIVSSVVTLIYLSASA